VKLETDEALKIHIEGLQATLTKRNARIAELEAKIIEIKDNPIVGAAEKAAYKKGWKDCAGHLMETANQAARGLKEIRKDAFRLYLEGDKLDA
jgi:hypothetical protein